MRTLCGFVVIFLFSAISRAQISQDPPTQALVLQALDHIYNYEFAKVEPLTKQIKVKYPSHPVNNLLKAVQWQWQYLPIKDNKSMAQPYVKLLEQCIQQAKVLEKTEATKPEAAFFSMAAHGYIGLMHNHNKDRIKAVGEAKRAYNYVMDGFDLLTRNPEFYFSTGMYNYYMVQYPNEHPIIKPITIFFKDGNKALGLKQIDVGTKKGYFTRTEAHFFATRIYLKHEAQPDKALPYIQPLTQKYPNNPVYLMKYIEALLMAQKYKEAQAALERLKPHNDKMFPMAVQVFEGILQEKLAKNDTEATNYYQASLKMPFDSEFTEQYRWFATAGLARIANRTKDQKRAFMLYKQVRDESEYLHLRREADAFLK